MSYRLLWSRGRAVVLHASAIAVHDLGTANPSRVHLTVPPGFRQRNAVIALRRADLDVLDSAVADLRNRGTATRRQLLHTAQSLGARAELGVERALRTLWLASILID
jgi:hypothetical protein